MKTVADIMHPDGNVLLRPEYGLFDGKWNAIACRNLKVLKSIQALYTRGRDIIISTGIIDTWTKPEYQSKLLAAVNIEPRQEIATRRLVDPAVYAAHIARHGKELWPKASPILCLYHLPRINARHIIPNAYSALSYTSGSGRLVGGALKVTGSEREAIMALPVKHIPFTLTDDVIAYQELLRANGVPTYKCR